MANQSKAPSATKTNLTNNTPVASKLSGFKASWSKASAKPSSPKTNASPVNINQADELGLSAALIGVGPAKAKAIVEYRKQNGAFKRVDDLVLVKGIGPATLEKNRDRLRLN
ncbi:MAG: helix-hairpin-helix domain-containing protein [Moraxellaceae bacterium]|nr:MAG: helix-hairpin-helix domain-containing protein [Moraxellaceae bacterium]